MEPVEQDHDKKHETGIKDIQVGLVSEQVTVEALQILGGPEDRSHHDKETSNVQSKHVLLPRETARGAGSRVGADRTVKGDRNDNENAEEEELHEETADNNFCSTSESLDGTGCLITTTLIN